MSTFWFSENNLERLIKNVKDLVSDAKSVFTGATSQSDGTSGQLPAPSAGDQDKYLKGDGTWATPSSSADFTGATSLANGAHGLVPQPLAGDENKCLKGDGSWTDLHSVPTFVGTQAEWNALSAAQQADYKIVELTDDTEPEGIVETLWSGAQGDYGSTVYTNSYPLSKSYRNFRTLRIHAIASWQLSGTGDKAYVRDISTEQLDFIKNTTASDISSSVRISSCWGYGSNTDFADIDTSSTPTSLTIVTMGTRIFKIEGSKY